MSTYAFFHKIDLDGYMSAAVVKMFVPDVILKPFNYNQPFPFDEIRYGDTVYFVDVTTSLLEDMLRVLDIVGEKNMIVIDHHKSFIDSEVGKLLSGKLGRNFYCYTDLAACELTWMYFSDSSGMPRAVHLLGQYDSWRDKPEKKHERDEPWNTVLEFQYGVRLVPLSIDYLLDRFIYPVRFMANEAIEKTIVQGRLILEYQNNQNSVTMQQSFDFELHGFRCLCVNTQMRNSQVFVSKWDPTIYDFMIAFSLNKHGKWGYSFYTDRDDRDASELAKMFGGGGHRGASGTVTDRLIFEKHYEPLKFPFQEHCDKIMREML